MMLNGLVENPLLNALLSYAGFMIVWMYGIAPLFIKQGLRRPTTVSFQPCEVAHCPKWVQRYFLANIPQLADVGFVSQGCAALVSRKVESYVSQWVNPSTGESAQIIAVVARKLFVVAKTRLVIFRSDFTDATAITTGNTPRDAIWPADPTVNSIRVRRMKDIAALLRLHRARVEHRRGERHTTLANLVDAVSRQQFEHTYAYERLIGVGYYFLDPNAATFTPMYAPTVKGAYRMTWQMLPPFRQIQRLRLNSEARKEMRAVGFVR